MSEWTIRKIVVIVFYVYVAFCCYCCCWDDEDFGIDLDLNLDLVELGIIIVIISSLSLTIYVSWLLLTTLALSSKFKGKSFSFLFPFIGFISWSEPLIYHVDLSVGLLISLPLAVNPDDEDFWLVDDDLSLLLPLVFVDVDDCIVVVLNDLHLGYVLLKLLFLRLVLLLLEQGLVLFLEGKKYSVVVSWDCCCCCCCCDDEDFDIDLDLGLGLDLWEPNLEYWILFEFFFDLLSLLLWILLWDVEWWLEWLLFLLLANNLNYISRKGHKINRDEDIGWVDDVLDPLLPLVFIDVDNCIGVVVDDSCAGYILLELFFLLLLLLLLEEVLLLFL